MQPQNYNTGHGGSDRGELTPAATPELPVPAIDASPTPAAGTTAAVSGSPGSPAAAAAGEQWGREVEQVFDRTVQNPRQRAEQLAELRRRYQQTVLGITQAEKAE